jgi:hypothetical protein
VTLRTIGTFVSALSLLVAATAYSPQAQASPVPILVEYDLTITFSPPTDPNQIGPPIFPNLTGAAAFTVPFSEFGNLVIGGFDIGTLSSKRSNYSG